jgi:hypothetical protein
MHIDTKIDDRNNLRIHVITGRFELSDLVSKLNTIYDTSSDLLEMDSLWDLRELMGLSSLDSSHLDILVQVVAKKWTPNTPRRAALVVSRTVDYGLARMYEMRLASKSKNRIHVFNDYDEAVIWLTVK